MSRSAPVGGYDFGNKRHYRRGAWAALERAAPKPMSECRCLLMPSSEGKEVEVALDHGVREYNLVLVDRNTQIVAHLKRKFRRAEGHGVDLARVIERLRKDKAPVDVANLDLCGYADGKQLRLLSNFAWGAVSARAALATTWIRGRERFYVWQSLAKYTKDFGVTTDKARLVLMQTAIERWLWTMHLKPQGKMNLAHHYAIEREWQRPVPEAYARLTGTGSYRSSSSLPMQWGAWSLWKAEEFRPLDVTMKTAHLAALRMVRDAARFGLPTAYHRALRLMARFGALSRQPIREWEPSLAQMEGDWEATRHELSSRTRLVEAMSRFVNARTLKEPTP